MLMVGFSVVYRDCTVRDAGSRGVAGEWHHSRAHAFFAYRRWDPDQLGLALLDFLVSVFVKTDAPVRLAVDDTLFGRSGRHVWGAHYLHDGAQPEGSGRRTRWECWVVVVLVVDWGALRRSVVCRSCSGVPQGRSAPRCGAAITPELARTLIDMILERLGARISSW